MNIKRLLHFHKDQLGHLAAAKSNIKCYVMKQKKILMHWQKCIKWIISFGKDNRGNGIFSWSALLVKSPSQAKYTSNPVDDLSYKRNLVDLLNQIMKLPDLLHFNSLTWSLLNGLNFAVKNRKNLKQMKKLQI